MTDILVRQKQITVGKAYFEDALITRPMAPGEILDKIRAFASEDVRELVLAQEILIFLSLLLKTEPQLFRGLLTLRVNFLVLLMTSELASERHLRQDEAFELLMQSSPSEVQRRLRNVLAARENSRGLLQQQESLHLASGEIQNSAPEITNRVLEPAEGWMRFRQREGALNRVPNDFYRRTWKLLHHCHGLVIGDKLEQRNRLDSALILSEMTADEKNFAVWVEHLLSKIEFPEYRQLNTEAIQVLCEVAERQPELRIEESVVLDVLIGHAVRLAWLENHPEREQNYDEDKPAAWQAFYESSPPLCARFLVQALQFLARTE